MVAMAFFWNKNYCVELLDDMINYCGKSGHILAHNLVILLSQIDFFIVDRLWSILHITIDMPMHWLAAKAHTMKDYEWSYITMGKVLDKLKDDLETIADQTELIHTNLS